MLHEHGTAIKVPVVFWLTADGTQPDNGFHLEFPAGDVAGNNRVGISQNGEGAFVNLGLTPYFRNNRRVRRRARPRGVRTVRLTVP